MSSRDLTAGKVFALAPVLPAAMAFGAGIYARAALGPSLHLVIALAALGFLLPVVAYLLRRRCSHLYIIPLFFFLGMLFMGPYLAGQGQGGSIADLVKEEERGRGEGGEKKGPLYDVRGRVATAPSYRGGRTRLVVRAEAVGLGKRWQRTRGGIRLSVQGRLEGIGPGDYVRFLGYLRRPHNFGNPGGFDYERWLRSRGIEVLGYVRSPAWIIRQGSLGRGPASEGAGLYGLGARVRSRINAFIDASGTPNGAILKALVTGERAGITPSQRAAFSRAGVAHVLAISGLHVGIVAFFTYFILFSILRYSAFLALRLNIRKAALLMSIPFVLAYGLMAGFSLPTERAVIMAVVLMLAITLDRGKSYYNTLGLAGLFILAAAPASLYEASFQLSFMAVFFILYLSPRIMAFFEGLGGGEEDPFQGLDAGDGPGARIREVFAALRRRVLLLASVTIAASLGTWPLVAYHFSTISTVGLFSNLFVLPLTTLIVEALFVSVMLMPLSGALASLGVKVAGLMAGGLMRIVQVLSAPGFSALHLSRPTAIEAALSYILVLSLFNVRRMRASRYAAAAAALVLVLFLAWPHVQSALDPRLRVTFISVGQGDSALVEFPRGSVMLIDGGGFGGGEGAFDTGKGIIAPLLRYKKIRRLDYMVLSHAQQDHMGGLVYMAANFPVGRLWWNGIGNLGALGRALKSARVPVRVLGTKREVFTVDGVRVEALPRPQGPGLGSNDTSLVIRIVYGARSFLFTGDIEAPAESFLSGLGDIKTTVLKAPHHGSDTGSTAVFLRAISPEITVISLGRGNRFGFPSSKSLARYRAVGSQVLRTDLDGAVEVSTNGEDLVVRTYGR